MAVSGFLKIDGTFLKTPAVKETSFDTSGFPSSLKDGESFLRRPGEATTSSVPTPNLKSYMGLKIGASADSVNYNQTQGGFSERPQQINLDGYYFPMGSDLKGSSLSNIKNDLLKPVAKVDPLLGDFENTSSVTYKNDPMFIYGNGVTPYSNDVNNLLTPTAIKSAWSNATAATLANNISSGIDGLAITPTNMSIDTIGSYRISPTSSGYYCFSFYARLNGRNYNPLNIRYLKMTISPACTESYVVSDSSSKINISTFLFNLEFEWKRYAVVAYLAQGNQYTINLNWFAKDTSISSLNNYRADSLKVASVLLEKKKWPTPYEVRQSNAHGDSSIQGTIYHLAAFNLDNLQNNIAQNKGWIISYKRMIMDNSSSTTAHYDSLGDTYWGYSGNQVVASNYGSGSQPSVAADDYYLKWEHVILQHKANESKIKVFIDATNSNKSYSFEIGTSGSSLSGTFRGQAYNLMLGCRPSTVASLSNASYRDLLYILDGSDTTLQKVRKNMMGMYTANMTVVVNDVKSTSTAVVVTDMNLFEKANLEY